MKHHPLLPKVAAFCAYQDRSRVEIEERMAELEIPETDWESIVAFLIKERYFDEKRFAESFVGGKFRVKNWGKRKIWFEIRKHRLPEILIQQAIQSEIPDDAYEAVIQKLIEKKSRELLKDTPAQRKAKLTRYLLQKGFEFEAFGEYLE